MSFRISDLEIAARGNYRSVVEILNRFPAEVDRQFTGSVTALQIAARAGHLEIIRLLANRGADLDCFDSEDRTPLHYAVNGNHPDAVQLLLKLGADMGEKDRNDETPPQLAFKKNYRQCVKKFLDVNPTVQLKGYSNETAETSDSETANAPSKCIICEKEAAVVTFEPCGHVVSCFTCCFTNVACRDCGKVIQNWSFQEDTQTRQYFKQIIELDNEVQKVTDQHTCSACRILLINCVLHGCGHARKCVRNNPSLPRVSRDKQTWVCFACGIPSRYIKLFPEWLVNND